MKKILSNDEMKNIFGGFNGDYVQRRIARWESSVGGSGSGVSQAFENLWRWAWSWFN